MKSANKMSVTIVKLSFSIYLYLLSRIDTGTYVFVHLAYPSTLLEEDAFFIKETDSLQIDL